MLGYKHLTKGTLLQFIHGHGIQLGSYAYYRAWEDDRGDKEEGLQSNRLDGIVSSQTEDSQYLSDFGFVNVDYAEYVTFENVTTVEHAPNDLIFCSSIAPDLELARQKDLHIAVIDLDIFASALLSANPCLAPVHIGHVKYDKSSGDILQRTATKFNPFQKPQRFQYENEIRMVFRGYPSARPYIRLVVPRPDLWLRGVRFPTQA